MNPQIPETQSEQPKIITSPPSHLLLLSIVIIAVALLSAGATYYYLSPQLNNTQPVLPQYQETTDQSYINSNQPTGEVAQSNITADLSWKKDTLSLYKLTLSHPVDWTVKEVNRRPEPTAAYIKKTGHDCADYTIATNDGTTTISLKPICGWGDGGGSPLPSDAVLVKKINEKSSLYRYFDTTTRTYIYTSAGPVEMTDPDGKQHTDIYMNHVISYGPDNNLIIIHSELTYTGTSDKKDSYLQTADKIIASLSYE